MSRILVGMASFNALVLLAAFSVGFYCEGRVQVQAGSSLTDSQKLFTYHLLSGLSATLLTLLLHSLIFTYFIGTGRWVQEVAKAYQFPEPFWERSRELKRKALPLILVSIMLVITVATLGAATDLGMLDSNFHLALAVLAIGCNFWSFFREYALVRANGEIITQIMTEVKRMRRERGLD